MINNAQKLICQTLEYGYEKKLKSFINQLNELIIFPKINAYFRLEDVQTELDFKKKVLHYISYFAAANHWDKYWSPKVIEYMNFILGTSFNAVEVDNIYKAVGNGSRPELCEKFILNNYDIKIINERSIL